MEEHEGSRFILSKLKLDDIERMVRGAYHKKGSAGRPPREPMGIFKALIIKRVQQVPSDRELCRRLWNDSELTDVLGEDLPPLSDQQIVKKINEIADRLVQAELVKPHL